MVSATSQLYNTYPLYQGASANGIAQVELAGNTFVLVLLASANNINNDQSAQSQLVGEISAANYTVNGITLANVTYTLAASGTATWDADNVIVTASGTDISAQAGIIVRRTAAGTGQTMIAIDFQGTQTAGDGTTFNVNWSADGILQVKPG